MVGVAHWAANDGRPQRWTSPKEKVKKGKGPCWLAPLYCPMLILACLTGVSGLVVYLCQWTITHSNIASL